MKALNRLQVSSLSTQTSLQSTYVYIIPKAKFFQGAKVYIFLHHIFFWIATVRKGEKNIDIFHWIFGRWSLIVVMKHFLG